MNTMERLLKISVLLLFLLALLYSSLWFYRADVTKRSLKAELASIEEFDIGNFRFGDIKVTGFPFSFTIEIIKLQLSINQNFAVTEDKTRYTRLSLPKLLIQSDFTGSTYRVEPVGDIHLQNPRQKHATILTKSPSVHLYLPQSTWKDTFSGVVDLDELCTFIYEDAGFDIISDDSGHSIFSGEGTEISFDCKKEQRNTHVDFSVTSSIKQGKGYNDFAEHNLLTKHVALNFNASAELSKIKGIAQQYIDLTVQEASLALDNSTLTLEGVFKGPTLMFYSPDAEINLALGITNYPELLDDSVENTWMTEHNKNAFAQLLPDIANTIDSKSLLLNIQRSSEKGAIHVGKMSFSEAMKAFTDYKKQNQTEKP